MGNEFKGLAAHSAEHFGDPRDHWWNRDRAARRLWNWSEAEGRRLFLAGGGAEADFAAHFARGLAFRDAIVRGLDDATYHGIVGGEFYVVSGRKPYS